jgi:hypothetical protein
MLAGGGEFDVSGGLTGGLPVAFGSADAGTAPGTGFAPVGGLAEAGGVAGAAAGCTLTSSTSNISIDPGGIGGRERRS